MGRRSDLRLHAFAPLLALLLLGAPAAAQNLEPDPQHAVRAALDRGDLRGAQALAEAAIARAGTRDSDAVWNLRVMRGEALIGLGNAPAARDALAFELPPRLRRSETAVRHLILRTYSAPDRAQALEVSRKAKALAEAHVPSTLADVYVAMIAVESSLERAEEYAREAIRQARKHGGRRSHAKAMASLAFVLAGRQNFAESIAWGEQALTLARSIHLEKIVQQIEGNLGWSYFEIGDYETAAELFTRAEATATRMNAKSDRVPWLIQLGNIRAQQRDWAGADRHYAQAVAVARETNHPQLGMALANLARSAIETGRFAEARRLNGEALEKKKDDREAELNSRVVEARILIVEGQYASARKLLEGVLRDTERITTRTEAAGRLAQLHVRANRRDLAEERFRFAVDAAREARENVRDRDLRFSLSNTTAEIFGEYVDFLVAAGRIEDALALTERGRAQTLEEGLPVPAKIDARNVAAGNAATILCYWLGRDRSYLWAVTKERVTLHRLPPDTTINKAVEAYRRELLGPRGSMQGSGAGGRALYEMLVKPAAIPRGARVIVVADGRLHALNFETLVVPAPSPRYWIEDAVVMNAASLQLLARTDGKHGASPSILLVGNAPSPDPAFPPLRHAAAEMRAIARRFERRTVLDGVKATPAAYRSASPGRFDYVHFVAHGVATRKRPLDSAVILARDASSRYKLLARDVAADPLHARLVTISSCHGAGTRTYAGEGVVGLAWAFLRAGADQVIAALWEVNDAATPQLMDRMYAGIRAGKDPATALRDAKLQLVRGTGAHKRPLYWAPFVLYAGT